MPDPLRGDEQRDAEEELDHGRRHRVGRAGLRQRVGAQPQGEHTDQGLRGDESDRERDAVQAGVLGSQHDHHRGGGEPLAPARMP